ncbi:PREDICTED: elicitor-responsive protein 1 [Ipomoea nil]|uniref:elicitor-responsive protein 1 n=1 Tax=Ipomoea nil TaxID=35883 RepID=UPI00090106D3|nr:PREDICTED: elicitor-responsive protein 1 [Ipomoea nil]
MSTVVGTMEVTLVNARGLKNNEFLGGGIDSYVLIHYRGQEHKSSIARGEGSNPTWNEKFNFRVEFPVADDDYKLLLTIMDHDTFSNDDYLGQSTVHLKEVFELGIENGTYELHPQKYSVVDSDQSFCGEIQVGISFSLKGTVDAEEYGGWRESDY